MYRHIKTLAVGAVIALTVGAGVAHGSETSSIRFPAGSFAINPHTCKFVHAEADKPLGQSWSEGRVAFAYEDARHDAKMQCLTHHLGRRGARGATGARGPAGPAGAPGAPGGVAGYTQVSASGTGKTVTATCPAGDVVLGGGSPDETTGSYPSSSSAWTIKRDHLSPARMTVVATCAKAAS